MFGAFLDVFVLWFTGWLAAVPIVAACPLMVSGYKSYKTHVSHALAGSRTLPRRFRRT